jgi:hypothetical protein
MIGIAVTKRMPWNDVVNGIAFSTTMLASK